MSMDKRRKVMVADVVIHYLANEHRLMTKKEYIQLVDSIRDEGQIIDALMYRGKLVDGRHRLKALKELGIEYIMVVDLSNNLTIDEVREIVRASEVRRTDSMTQKAIKAYNYSIQNPEVSQTKLASKFCIDQSEISRAKKLATLVSPSDIDFIFNNGYLTIGGKRYTQLRKMLAAYKTTLVVDNQVAISKNSTAQRIIEELSAFIINNDINSLSDIVNEARNGINIINNREI